MTLATGTIPKLLKRSAYDLIMFGYVRGVRNAFPNVSVEKALWRFAEEFNLADDFQIEGAKKAYARMNDELRENGKTTH